MIRLTGHIILIGGVRLGGTSPIPRGVTYDPSTIAWVNAVTTAGGSVSTTQENYVNTLITCYKSAGIFSLLDREWLLWSDNVQQAETDLIHDDTWTSHGTSGFTADAGYTGDGSTSYLDTNFEPHVASFSGGNFAQNSASMDVYITHGGNNGVPIGANDGTAWSDMQPVSSGNKFCYDLNDAVFPCITNTSAVGLWSIFRTSSSTVTAYKNGGAFTSDSADTSTANLNADIYIGAYYDDYGGAITDNFSNDTLAMAGIGGGLTGTQEAAKAACDDAYATSKGFNVF